MKQFKSIKKFNDDGWYVCYDGSSAFALLGMDCQEFLDEDPEVNEVIDGPYDAEMVDIECEIWNEQIQD